MRLSTLQEYILRVVLEEGGRVNRSLFLQFYEIKKSNSKPKLRGKIISQSLERMIERGMLIGYGHRTREKWIIDAVKLTSLGRIEAERLFGEQQLLPLKKRKKS